MNEVEVRKLGEKIEICKYDDFDVYSINEGHSFVYANFNDENKFIDGLTDYLFSEDNLLNYAHRTSKVAFTGEIKQWVRLYHNISIFLNSKLETLEIGDVTEELKNILGEEYKLIDVNGELKVQKDKVGKIGEYAFHILLTNYFQLDCIVPKFRCTTDRNMSVFGIDTLFLDTRNKILYFGESKFSKNIESGIKLANRSLQEYEQQIREEYRGVLSSSDAFDLSDEFIDIFGEARQLCISFEKLIEIAHITEIGVPIFIAHGNTGAKDNPEDYIQNMRKKINNQSFFGLSTKYIFISLPVISKNKFIEIAIKKVVKKYHEYEQRSS